MQAFQTIESFGKVVFVTLRNTKTIFILAIKTPSYFYDRSRPVTTGKAQPKNKKGKNISPQVFP